jgi:putative membrane-bound dehydrogenase-like protein
MRGYHMKTIAVVLLLGLGALPPVVLLGARTSGRAAAVEGTIFPRLPQGSPSSQEPIDPAVPRLKPTEAREAQKTFSLQPGYSIELVASEPLIQSPVDIAFDETGRLWAIEMVDYPFGDKEGNPPQGRLVVLESSAQDGRFDKREIIADHLRWPTGLALWQGGVYVVAAPDLLYFKGKEKTVVYTGLGTQNVQGLANNPKWGLDNWFYVSTGSNGGQIPRPGGGELGVNGRDFRFRPTGEIEACSGGGQFGLSFDPFGRRYACSNANNAKHVVLEDWFLARNPYYAVPQTVASIAKDGDAGTVYRTSPDEPWRVVRTKMRVQANRGGIEGGGRPSGYFTSATGIFWHDGYLFVGEVAGNLVHRKSIAPNGSTFSADRIEKESEFLSSSDIWFRPVNFATGPDGALYVIDMYRECIEHPYSIPDSVKKFMDLTSGKERGRLWRVRREGQPSWSKPDLSDLAGALARPEAWYRNTAARLITERRDRSLTPAIEKLLSHERPETRVAALWALAALGLEKGDFLLHDPVPAVREAAVPLASFDALWEFAESDPRVKLALAVRLSETKDPRAKPALERLKPGADKWLLWAIAVASGEKTSTKPLKIAPPIVREPAPDRKKALEDYQAALSKKGDAARGKEIYLKTCAGCHRAKGDGVAVGPDFTTVTTRSPEDLLIAIIDPNREVNPQYVSTRIRTTDGDVIDGIVVSETATSVTLRREKGETYTILRIKIDKLVRSTFSLMPEGLEKTIDHQAMADLIQFIRE